MNIRFDSKSVYGDNDMKIKSYGDKVNTRLKKMPEENASNKCLSLVVLQSSIRVNKKYYPQTFLEEWKNKIIRNKKENLTNDDLSSGLSDNGSDRDSND